MSEGRTPPFLPSRNGNFIVFNVCDLPKLDALENFVEENSAAHEFSLLTKFSEMDWHLGKIGNFLGKLA